MDFGAAAAWISANDQLKLAHFTVPIGTLAERGCVVPDQPQQVGKSWSLEHIQLPGLAESAAAGFRHSRAPG